MNRLRHNEAMRVLLDGVSGVNTLRVGREAGLSHNAVREFMRGAQEPREKTVESLGWFIWRRLNVHVLLAPAENGGPDGWMAALPARLAVPPAPHDAPGEARGVRPHETGAQG
jgi:hypothetical protein